MVSVWIEPCLGIKRSGMPPSIFQGVQLPQRLPRYATLRDHLVLDYPAAARLRRIVDAWVRADPPAIRSKIRTDLLGESSCPGTFSELVLREVLRQKFGAVQQEPKGLPVGGKTPDFAVRVGRLSKEVVFESTTIVEKVNPLVHRRRDIMRRLDRISGPWHLIPHWVPSTGLESVLGAVDGAGRIVAISSFYLTPYPPRPQAQPSVELAFMAVDPALQGRGIGSAVMAEAIRRLKATDSVILWANARDSALRFYERCGFTTAPGSGYTPPETGRPHSLIELDLVQSSMRV